jgi:hypothetical protein
MPCGNRRADAQATSDARRRTIVRAGAATRAPIASADRPATAGYASLTFVLLAYLYVSRFVHDVALVGAAVVALLLGTAGLSRDGLLLTLGMIVAVVLQLFVLGARVEDPAQVFHLAYVLLIAVAMVDFRFRPEVLERFCLLTTAWNVGWLMLGLVPPFDSIAYWTGQTDTPRFQSTLPEPSFVGLYSALNFFVLLRAGRTYAAYLNLLPLGASFSFAGVLSFGLLGLFQFRRVWRHMVGGGALLAVLLAAVWLLNPQLLIGLVVDRVAGFAAGGQEESFTLRFIAPVDLVRYTLTLPDVHAWIGLGLGNVEHYLHFEQVALPNHWRADGVRSPEPDSVIAFLVGAFGILGVLALAVLAYWVFTRRPSAPTFGALKAFLVAVALLTGLFISMHFWLWIYLLRQERRFREDSSTRPAASVPGH